MAENEFYTQVPVDLIKNLQDRLEKLSYLRWYDDQNRSDLFWPTAEQKEKYRAIVKELDQEERDSCNSK
jgi:hypothetical protein